VNSTKRKTIIGTGLGALAAALSGAAIYATQAGAQPGHPVNPPVATTPAAPTSFADIVERVAPAVVSIDVEERTGPSHAVFSRGRQLPDSDQEDGDQDDDSPFGFAIPGFGGGGRNIQPQQIEPLQATGSGFFISGDGYIVTNNHVVENASKITVRTNDDRTLQAKLIGRDPATDLAVIKVEGGKYPYVSFEDRGMPRVGDWVVAVGNPFNLGSTVTAGIVSALARPNISGSSFVDYMQIDAPINRGNSGGPSFDLSGRVVGVNSAIFSPSGGSVGIGFDIPADVAASVTKSLISSGKVVRGYIGASVQGVTPDIAESIGRKGTKGALVAGLTTGGPAARAGLQTGDLVTKIDGHEVLSSADLTRHVGLAVVGQDIHLQVLRDGQARQITIRAGERPPEDKLALNDRGGPER
jgi:serine protease Do